MVGDGFGGRLWYQPSKFSVGSYSGYTICSDSINPQNNQLFGWGSNSYNQLGLGMSIDGVNLPELIPQIDSVRFFTTGYVMGAIKYDNTGWAWGIGGSFGSSTLDQQPVQIISDVYFCDAGSTTVCYVKNNGTVWTIGSNQTGCFGNGTYAPDYTTTPSQMLDVNSAVRVASNYVTNCVLLSDSSLLITGSSYLGLGETISQINQPQPITGLPKIIDVKSNARGTIALSAEGDVYFWGDDINGMHYTPTKLNSLNNIVAISGCDDGYHFMALDSTKNCYAWGDNWLQFGSQGDTPLSCQNPELVASDVIDIMAGETFSYIIKSDHSLWATGQSTYGSIWLDLSNEPRTQFTRLNPDIVPGWCKAFSIDAIEIPNVFTPNGDQINDYFRFLNLQVEELNATILNRWGNIVKTFNSPNDSWDGNSNTGQPCSEGTYFYTVNFKPYNLEWATKSGYITLKR